MRIRDPRAPAQVELLHWRQLPQTRSGQRGIAAQIQMTQTLRLHPHCWRDGGQIVVGDIAAGKVQFAESADTKGR
ncbi:hypothetical protein GCM10022212_24300 [Actimicrobium antarcticum]|uniref:Uncharacterized protein n=1 Tax=Actimicrobium antarcticum TaxID=1051899 RepID=A0ABP7TFZ1_9BURK